MVLIQKKSENLHESSSPRLPSMSPSSSSSRKESSSSPPRPPPPLGPIVFMLLRFVHKSQSGLLYSHFCLFITIIIIKRIISATYQPLWSNFYDDKLERVMELRHKRWITEWLPSLWKRGTISILIWIFLLNTWVLQMKWNTLTTIPQPELIAAQLLLTFVNLWVL